MKSKVKTSQKIRQRFVIHHAPQMRGTDSGFSETYMEYGDEEPQASVTKQVGMRGVLQKVIVVVGPTASGKSDLAVEIAHLVNGEVISADSRQVYCGLDIGSGKITKREMLGIPHHLLDVANPKRQFSVAQYNRLATRAIKDILKRGKVPIICGGTGFYIDTLIGTTTIPEVPPNQELRKKLEKKSVESLFKMIQKLDPRRAKDIDEKNPVRLIRAIEIARALGSVPHLETKRPSYDVLQIGIAVDRDTLREKISARLTRRIKKGMLAEGRRLHAEGLSWRRMRALGLEYRAMTNHLTDAITRAELEQTIITESMHYAKRQMTWFKRNKNIKWFKPSEQVKVFKNVKRFLKN